MSLFIKPLTLHIKRFQKTIFCNRLVDSFVGKQVGNAWICVLVLCGNKIQVRRFSCA